MPYAESDLLPISALQHLLYCDRQCALILVERQWAENRETAEGLLLHKRAHGGRTTTRPGGRFLRAIPLRSLELGLFGVADVVRWSAGEAPVPVEYKRGRPKKNDCDRVQLCAQALCLEEMTGRPVPLGELFNGTTRRRVAVEMSAGLRDLTAGAAARLHELVRSGRTPPADPGPKCDRCSLRGLCLPRLRLGRSRSARSEFDRLLDALDSPDLADREGG
ncbi:CRISPR-associated protein Cas4 [Tautonia sociabilis]|uniref:CRISPR-associated exonuclease Cas4 n=1 Tax=Tautonia sociabilis TaxID=2080755 RepID=A0A432ME70_9BACT|nr:CRISPR-associated protein Cas4 [Tautonia sociabilis]RUL83502.1 CRISPR-associated protein Cas4 [Tautonia sociabilis]